MICWHPDRLYRSMKDLERLIEVVDAAGSQIRTVKAATSTCPHHGSDDGAHLGCGEP